MVLTLCPRFWLLTSCRRLREIRIKDVKKCPKKSPKKDGKVRKNRKGKCIAAISATSQRVNVGALEELQAARNLALLSGQNGGDIETLVDTLIVSPSPFPSRPIRS